MKGLKGNLLVAGLGALCLFLGLQWVQDCGRAKKAEKSLRDAYEQVSELQGTVSLSEDTVMRQGVELDDLRRNLDLLSDENSELLGLIDKRDETIRIAGTIEADLRRQLEFASENEGSSATVTVIRGCDEIEPETGNGTVEVTPDEPEAEIPNIRVDFNLTEDGFRIRGHTTTSPATAVATLEQLEPFRLNLAVSETDDGRWNAYVEDLSGLLSLEIAEFAVDPAEHRLRWFERVGFGIDSAITDDFAIGPQMTMSFGRTDVSVGGLWSTSNSWGAGVSLTWFPFRRR